MESKGTIAAIILAGLVLLVLKGEFLRLSYSAGTDGFHLRYHISLLGRGRVDLQEPDGQPRTVALRVLLLPVATARLALASIDAGASPPSLSLHYEITSWLLQAPLSGTVTVPFGQAGIRARLFAKRFFFPTESQVDVRMLLTKKKAAYHIALALPNLPAATWSETADTENSHIQQDLTLDAQTIGTLDLTVQPAPLLTTVDYAISLNASAFLGLTDNDTSSYAGRLVLPNGSYHFWYNGPQ